MASGNNLQKRNIIITAIAVLLALFFLINYMAGIYAKKLINQSISKIKGGYNLQLDKVRLNLFTSSATLCGIHGASASRNDSLPKINFDVDELRITGINWYSLLIKKTISVNVIEVMQPVISAKHLRKSKDSPDGDSTQSSFSLYNAFKSKYQSLHIGKLLISNARMQITAIDSGDFSMDLQSVNFEMENIDADSSDAAAQRIMKVGKVTSSINDMELFFNKGLYHLSIPALSFSTEDTLIQIDSLRLIPTVDKTQFGKQLGYQMDCFNILAKNIRIYSAKWRAMFEQQQINIDSVVIRYLKLQDYRDKNIPRRFVVHHLQHTAFDSITVPFSISNTILKDADITYEELKEGSTDAGHISFNNVKSTLENVTNENMQDTIKLKASGAMMSQAAIKIDVKFPLAKNEFYVIGSMGPWNMKIVNPMIKNFAPIEITDGKAKNMTMEFSANETSGLGKMTFTYSDLAVKVMQEEKKVGDSSDPVNEMASFVANFVLINDNPDKNVLRVGKIEYTRNPGRNFINYIWNLTFSGIKSSIGLQQEKTKKKIPENKDGKK